MNNCKLSIVITTASWLIIVLVIAGILFGSYLEIRGRMPGRVANARIEMYTSVVFSKEEIKSAIDVAIRDFAGSRDSWNELYEILYSEGYSNALISRRGWDAGNAIVLIANYQRNSAPGSNRPSIMSRWEWALFRDGPNDEWRIVAGGKIL